MDGYEATRKIRQHAQFSKLPVVALTAGAFKTLQEAAIDAGMDDFITKPFDIELMLDKINYWAGRSQRVLPKNNATVPERSTSAEINTNLPTLPGIDMAGGLAIWGNVKDFQTYLLYFIDQFHEAGHEMLGLLEQENISAVARLAHKLKGAAANLALTQISNLCVQVENALETPDALAESVKSLQAALDEVKQSIHAWIPDHSDTSPTLNDEKSIRDHWSTIEPLFIQLMNALDEDKPNLAEEILTQLSPLMNEYYLAPIKAALAQFDFREAEKLVRIVIHTFTHS
jgi:CheY-like chemotaxis protein